MRLSPLLPLALIAAAVTTPSAAAQQKASARLFTRVDGDRVQAALEVESMVRDLREARDFDRVALLIAQLVSEMAESPQPNSRKGALHALAGTAIATAIMLFFALCGAWILGYLDITEATFNIAGGIILFLVALDILAANRQQRKCAESTSSCTA